MALVFGFLTDIAMIATAGPILLVLACGAALGLMVGIPVYIYQWCRYHWAPRPYQIITPEQIERREHGVERQIRVWKEWTPES